MISLSVPVLDFHPEEKQQHLMMTNKQPCSLLFKVSIDLSQIKTNNVNAIDAKPCFGCLQSHATIKITVKRNMALNQQVKLQITYTQCPEELTKQNFKELWNKYSKNQQAQLIPIRIIQKPSNQSEQKIISPNKQQKPKEEEFISQIQIQSNHKVSSPEKPIPPQPPLNNSAKTQTIKVGKKVEISPMVLGLLFGLVFITGYVMGYTTG